METDRDKISQVLNNFLNRYYRVESGDMKSVSDFELGFYLSTEIIKRHSGKVWVESEIGNDSLFYLSLPTAKTSYLEGY